MVDPLVVAAGTPFLLAGTLLLWYGGRLGLGLLRRHRQTRTVEAEIVEASVSEVEEAVFEPTVRFRYDHDGQTYESTLVREGRDPPAGAREVAESFLEPYEVGQTVTATLLTSMPDQAVLERSTDRWPYVVAVTTALLGAVFTFLGGGIVVGGLVG
jgi:hypothetical protein